MKWSDEKIKYALVIGFMATYTIVYWVIAVNYIEDKKETDSDDKNINRWVIGSILYVGLLLPLYPLSYSAGEKLLQFYKTHPSNRSKDSVQS